MLIFQVKGLEHSKPFFYICNAILHMVIGSLRRASVNCSLRILRMSIFYAPMSRLISQRLIRTYNRKAVAYPKTLY